MLLRICDYFYNQNTKQGRNMINMTVIGSFNGIHMEKGKSYELDMTKPTNPGKELLIIEEEADSRYEAWVSSVSDQDKLSKQQFKSNTRTNFDARQLQLSEIDQLGVNGISEATGFSRTTVHTFYALSVSSGLVNSMDEFVSKMVGEPTQSYNHLKNRLTEDEGAKILSTLA